MAATIRLMRIGKKGYPSYRIVVCDKRKKRNSDYLEQLGIYNPIEQNKNFQIDEEKLKLWLSRGAMISEGMNKLFATKIKSLRRSFKKD